MSLSTWLISVVIIVVVYLAIFFHGYSYGREDERKESKS